MAESNGSGILGVIVGAMLVVFVGAAFLYGTGRLGNSQPTLEIKLPTLH